MSALEFLKAFSSALRQCFSFSKVPTSKWLTNNFSLAGHKAIYEYPETALIRGFQRGMGTLVARQERVQSGWGRL